jgi:hypothetical protein
MKRKSFNELFVYRKNRRKNKKMRKYNIFQLNKPINPEIFEDQS